MDTRFKDMFEKRGIDPLSDIVGERPYTPYRAGEHDVLFAEDPKYRDELRPGQVRFVKRLVKQRDGVIMRRHACLSGLPEPWAQIRPYRDGDDPGVLIQTFRHRHPWAYVHMHRNDGELRIQPSPRHDGVQRRSLISPRGIQAHERNHPRGPEIVPDEIRSAMTSDMRMHPHWWNWSAHLTTGEYADQHDPDMGSKWHEHQDYARYLYAPGDPERPESGKERSAGVDVHPLAEELIDHGGRRVYYALEGILKNDALLAQNVPVFNTGSVTLWLPDELRRFAAMRLLGSFEQIVVVPDSDWHSNPQVSRQANRVANLLRREYLDVVIAAPPAECGPVCNHTDRAMKRSHKVGIDDYIGEGGTVRTMIAMHVDRDRAPEVIASKRRVALLIEHAIANCDTLGNLYASMDEVADAVGVDRRTVSAAIADAESEGLVKYTAPDPEVEGFASVGKLTLRKDLRPDVSFEEIGD
jgi:hypothetical protein